MVQVTIVEEASSLCGFFSTFFNLILCCGFIPFILICYIFRNEIRKRLDELYSETKKHIQHVNEPCEVTTNTVSKEYVQPIFTVREPGRSILIDLNNAQYSFASTERERIERERIEKERAEKECAERERIEKQRAEKECAERERIEKQRAEKECAEKQRAERERIEKQRAEKKRLNEEKLKRLDEERNRILGEIYEEK